ncbi:ATP-binding protein [Nocardiopsis ganjiahuensis]|uniref:ATP-binding protein n=1 Tax=Nocardiopsis ganjiahuensis TaxID=239984 RepID=UPI000344E277|nr:ATP-binding protein [Nocardiopsis ganjiahuensis]
MTSLPHVRPPLHTSTEPFAGRRWPSRLYPGDLAQTSWVRTDLTADLHRLSGMDQETSENMVFCASEMFSNSVDHSRSGQDTEGRVVRTLHMPTATTLQVAIIDDGMRTDTTEFQDPQTPQHTLEEWAHAERGRGLMLIDRLADSWGTRSVIDFPFCQGLGTVIWAEFNLPEANR